MVQTENYSLNKVEGTDYVNIPTQFNPNWDVIDEEMWKNRNGNFCVAIENVLENSHSITRLDPKTDLFVFVATGDWHQGDVASVDGQTVQMRFTNGAALGTNAYITNQAVLCYLNGSICNVMASGTQKTVSDTFDAINLKIGNTDISGIGDGTITGSIFSINFDLDDLIGVVGRNEFSTASFISGLYKAVNPVTKEVIFTCSSWVSIESLLTATLAQKPANDIRFPCLISNNGIFMGNVTLNNSGKFSVLRSNVYGSTGYTAITTGSVMFNGVFIHA